MSHVVVLALCVSGVMNGPCCAKRESKSESATRIFAELKGLAGEWEQVGESGEKPKTGVTYRATAGGSALLEILFPGTDLEMVSLYHREGDDVIMTHYCVAGNQPRMRARQGKAPNEIVFELVGGSNFDPAKDPHIHGGVVRIVDRDRIHSEWEFYKDGKPAETHRLELVRRR